MSEQRSIPTHDEIGALSAAVSGGQLDARQRELVAQLLVMIGSAVRDPAPELCVWDPVREDYGALLAAWPGAAYDTEAKVRRSTTHF